MKKLLLAASAAAVALTVTTAANAAPTFTVTLTSNAYAIPVGVGNAGNDFSDPLKNVYGLTYEALGALVSATEDGIVTFEYMGSESGYLDTFTGGSAVLTETSGGTEGLFDPGKEPTSSFIPGTDLTNLLQFTSSGGVSAKPGQSGFAVYLPGYQDVGTTYTSDVIWLAYDDGGGGPDDNHDDMIIRATIRAVPEPATWAMMVAGVAAVGLSMRRRAATTRVAFS